MTCCVNLYKCEITAALEVTRFVAKIGFQCLHLCLIVALLARPFECFSPALVSEPIADEVRISSVDKDRNLGEQVRHEAMEGPHPANR